VGKIIEYKKRNAGTERPRWGGKALNSQGEKWLLERKEKGGKGAKKRAGTVGCSERLLEPPILNHFDPIKYKGKGGL